MQNRISKLLRIPVSSVAALLVANTAASAVPLAFSGLDATWSVTWDAANTRFDYRYTFSGAPANLLNIAGLSIAEATAHTLRHNHGEVAFINDGGVQSYDLPPPIVPLHTYNWSLLDSDALGRFTVGFSDIHAPVMSAARLDFAPNATFDVFTLPVPIANPFIPAAAIGGVGGGGHFGGIEGGLGGVCAVTVTGNNDCYTYLGSVAQPVAGGFLYLKFLKNTGEVVIGPDVADPNGGPPAVPDNFTSHYEAVHPSHNGPVDDEDFFDARIPDNAYAVFFGEDSAGYLDGDVDFHPARIGIPNYYWEGLGDGLLGPWAIGQVLTVGFFDPHGPTNTAWGGLVVGSQGTGGSNSLDTSPVNPQVVPEPASGALLGAGLLLLYRRRRNSRA